MSHENKEASRSAVVEDRLPYRVELWDEQRSGIERLLGRAVNVTLARAIFIAAEKEHADRYITLRHGARIIAETK